MGQVDSLSFRQDEGESTAVDERLFGMRQYCARGILKDGAYMEESFPACEAVAAAANKLSIRRE